MMKSAGETLQYNITVVLIEVVGGGDCVNRAREIEFVVCLGVLVIMLLTLSV